MTRKLKALILILVANCIKWLCTMMVFIQIKGKYSENFVIRLNIPDTSLITDEISSEVTAQTFEGLYIRKR